MKNKKGLAVIIASKKEFDSIKSFLSDDVLYLNWSDMMLTRPTAVVIWAEEETYCSTGTIGCAVNMQESGIRTVKFNTFFK